MQWFCVCLTCKKKQCKNEKYDTTGLNLWKYIDNTIQPKL